MNSANMNPASTKPAKFWDNIAEKYSKQPIADEASYQKKLELTQQYFRSDMEVLEFGCGTGSTAIIHASNVKQIRAIDVSAKMLEIAQAKADAAGIDNISFEQNTIEDLQAPDDSFDVVLGLSILHLLEDREAAIAKVHRMLKPGGYFITSTTCLGDFFPLFKLIGPIGKALGLFPLVKVFTAKDLVEKIEAGKFTVEQQWQPAKNKAIFIVAKKT